MEILIAIAAIAALLIGGVALAQIASLRRENGEVLEELKALRNAVDAFESPARGESVAAVDETEVSAPAPVVAAKSVAVEAPAVSSEIPETILAVIAASVAGAIRGQYRILAIQAANQAPTVSVAIPDIEWSHEGRREIYTSHTLR